MPGPAPIWPAPPLQAGAGAGGRVQLARLMLHTASRLEAFTTAALCRLGVPEADARLVAESLVGAELEDHASHGMLRLPFLLRRLGARQINPRPRFRIESVRAAATTLDADNGLGPVAGARAVDLAVTSAGQAGCGVVAVHHSNHLGALGFYLRRFADRGVIGLVFSNTPPAMAPPGGSRPHLGTNPIAAGFPTSGDPVLVDMATSQVARGRILRASRDRVPIPAGWALDAGGQATTDPAAALAGSLVPLGGDKGFALAVMVEALSGVLSGSAVGPGVGGTFAASDRDSDVGHCFVAIDPAAFVAGFTERMDDLAADLRRLGGRAPGDRRHAERRRRLDVGVELTGELVAELAEAAGAPL